MLIIGLVILYGASAVGLAYWNRRKGHGFWLGFWYSVLLTPVVGLLTIALAQRVVVVEFGTMRKRSCPHCYNLTASSLSYCEVCGKHLMRHTTRQYLQMAELFVGLVVVILVVRSMM